MMHGADDAKEDDVLGRFSTGLGEKYGFNLYNANLHMAIVTVDLIKATHRMRTCGSVLFSMDPESKRGEEEEKHLAIAVETVLGTCPFLDISRTITGAPEYVTLLEKHIKEQRDAGL